MAQTGSRICVRLGVTCRIGSFIIIGGFSTRLRKSWLTPPGDVLFDPFGLWVGLIRAEAGESGRPEARQEIAGAVDGGG